MTKKDDKINKKHYWGIQKMGKYLSDNYSCGSIIERASYGKNQTKPYKVYGSLIERKITRKDDVVLWERVKRIIKK